MNENYSSTNEPVDHTAPAVETETADPSKRVVQWGDGRTPDPDKICTARKSSGEPCRKQRVLGAVVCATHGGRAPQVKDKARVRLSMAADKLARELLKIAIDDDEIPAAVKLAAVKSALDRVGLSEKHALELEVAPTKEFESILASMVGGGSRAESRARRGVDDGDSQPDWLRDELEIVEAEVIDDDEQDSPAPVPQPQRIEPRPEEPSSGLLPMEDALDQLRASTPPPAPQARRRNGNRRG